MIHRRDLVESAALGQRWSVNLHPAEDHQSSKVDVSNETILPWLEAALSCLSTFPDAALLPTSYQQVTAAWNLAQQRLRLGKHSAVLYQLRHLGASWDRFKNYRTILDVKLRGRWSSDHSLRRYEQHAMVAQHYEELPQATKAMAAAAPQLLRSLVLGKCGLCWLWQVVQGLCASGLPAEAWDMEYNPDCNLSCPKVIQQLIRRIKARGFFLLCI